MENCMLVRLKGASTNEDLPVFETVIEKEWIKTMADNQYIQVVTSFSNKNQVYDFTFKANSAQMGEGYHYIVGNSANYYTFEIAKGENEGEGVFRYKNGNETGTITCLLDVEHTVEFNQKVQKLIFDGTEYSLENASSSSTSTNILIFGSGSTPTSKAGAISIGEFVHRNYTSPYGIRNQYKPYIINGEAYISDREKGVSIAEANGGELEAYDEGE